MQIIGGMEKGHAPPFLYKHEAKGTDVVSYHLPADESGMLCNAIQKEPFPPVSLPKREYMEQRPGAVGGVHAAAPESQDAVVRLLPGPVGRELTRKPGSRWRDATSRPARSSSHGASRPARWEDEDH